MQSRDLATHVEAEPRPGRRLPRGLRPIEAFEDAVALLGGDACSVIAHPEHGAAAFVLQRDQDVAGAAVTDRVHREVVEDLAEAARVAGHEHQLVREVDPDHAAAGHRAKPGRRCHHDLREVGRREHDVESADIEAGRIEKVIDERGEALDLVVSARQRGRDKVSGPALREAERKLDLTPDGGHRRLQLVAGHREERRPLALGFRHHGDILVCGDGADDRAGAVSEGGAVREQVESPSVEAGVSDQLSAHFVTAERARNRHVRQGIRGSVGAGERPGERTGQARRRRVCPLKEIPGRLVLERDPPGRIHEHDTDRKDVDDLGEPVALRLEDLDVGRLLRSHRLGSVPARIRWLVPRSRGPQGLGSTATLRI